MNSAKTTLNTCAEVIPGVLEQKKAGEEAFLYDAVMPCQLTLQGLIGEYGKIQRIADSVTSFLRVGDVIIKRLNPDCAVVFEDGEVQVLPSANLFVIRPIAHVLNPCYLAFILENSNAFDKLSQRSGIGTAVSAVTVNQIRNCEIPLPPIEEQEKLGALWKCAKKRNFLLQQLISENNRLLRSISEKLYQ